MNDRFKFRIFIKNESNPKYNGMFKVHSLHLGTNKAIISSQHGNVSIKLDSNKILMQSTGLKDKNGTLIYEGDCLGGIYEGLYIHWCNECKQFQLKARDYGCMACEGDIHWYEVVEDNNKLEVTGNIYENKELLDERN